jgi:hypothetical protein
MIPLRKINPTMTSNSNKRRLNQSQANTKSEGENEVDSGALKTMAMNDCRNHDDRFIQTFTQCNPQQLKQHGEEQEHLYQQKCRRWIACSSNGIINKRQRVRRRRSILWDEHSNGNSNRPHYNICLGIMLCTVLSFFTTSTSTSSFLCYAQEINIHHPYHPSIPLKKRRLVDNNNANDEDDFYKFEDDDIYTPAPTKQPTFPPTPHPTKYPTFSPTARPSSEPTRAGDDFYEVQIDDYTVEAQSAEIYISSMTDVILCLLCTFFWVLWLVGTIFPTKIQHLYKSEGIVVIGDVLESYVTLGGGGGGSGAAARAVGGGEGSPMININNDDAESDPDMHAGGGDTFDELNDMPSYHAIVSYVVPGPIAVGRRRKAKATSSTQHRYELQHEQTIPTSNYFLQSNESDNLKMTTKSLHPITAEDHAMEELNSKLNVDHVKATMQVMKGTPPRPPRSSSAINNNSQTSPKKRSPRSRSASPDSMRVNDGMQNRQLSKISEEGRNANHGVKNLLDSCTKSFETATSTKEKKKLREEMQKLGYYRYNRNNKTEYTTKDDPDEYEDPELIGNLFHSMGLSSMVMQRAKGSDKEASPVRVKKRFDTNELLKQGSKNVEIIVLPGNPGSGILKSEFELEEDYMLNGTVSSDLDGSHNPGDILGDANGGQIGDITAGIIGVVLASVSVIGAVHGVLTLPYQIRACK